MPSLAKPRYMSLWLMYCDETKFHSEVSSPSRHSSLRCHLGRRSPPTPTTCPPAAADRGVSSRGFLRGSMQSRALVKPARIYEVHNMVCSKIQGSVRGGLHGFCFFDEVWDWHFSRTVAHHTLALSKEPVTDQNSPTSFLRVAARRRELRSRSS